MEEFELSKEVLDEGDTSPNSRQQPGSSIDLNNTYFNDASVSDKHKSPKDNTWTTKGQTDSQKNQVKMTTKSQTDSHKNRVKRTTKSPTDSHKNKVKKATKSQNSTHKRARVDSDDTTQAKKPKYASYESVNQLTQLVLNLGEKLDQLNGNTGHTDSQKDRVESDGEISDQGEVIYDVNEESDISGDEIEQLLESPKRDSSKEANTTDTHGKDEDSDLEQMMGQFEKNKKVGPPVSTKVENALKQVLNKDVNYTKIDELMEQYIPPANLTGLATPGVNIEIWGKLRDQTKTNDIKLQKGQKRISAGLVSLAYTIDKMVELKEKYPEMKSIIKEGINAFALFSAANSETNFRRKIMIKPELNQRFQDLVKVATPGAEFLFGDDLCKSVKDLSETSKVGFDLAMTKKYRYQPTFAGVKDNNSNNYSYRNATKNNYVGAKNSSYACSLCRR